jgi:hypothetical protein
VRNGRFRLAAKKLALTYPRCDVPKEDALQRIVAFFGDKLDHACVSRETHADGGLHLHAGVWLKERMDTQSPSYLDFIGDKHGDYRSMFKPRGWVEYLLKEDGAPACWPEDWDPKHYLDDVKQHRKLGFHGAAKVLLEGGTIDDVIEKDAGLVAANLRRLQAFQAYLQYRDQVPRLPWSRIPSPPDFTWNSWSLEIRRWLNKNIGTTRVRKQEQLFIQAPTNHGKTALIMALSRYCKIYFPSAEEDFYDGYSDRTCDLIVFDEYNGCRTMGHLNALLEGAHQTLRIKGSTYLKQKNVPVILLSNSSLEEIYRAASVVHEATFRALQGRFKTVCIPEAEPGQVRGDRTLFKLVEALGGDPTLEQGEEEDEEEIQALIL